MALVQCRECGQRVSTEAHACPHCGTTNPAPPPCPDPHQAADPQQRSSGGRTLSTIVRIGAFIVAFIVVRGIVERVRSPEEFSIDEADLQQYGMSGSTARVFARELNSWIASYGGARGLCEGVYGAKCEDTGLGGDFEVGAIFGQQALIRGTARLGKPTIDSLAAWRLRLLDRLSVAECAQLSRGTISKRSQVGLVWSKLDSVAATRIVRLMRPAFEADARDYPSSPVFTEEASDDAFVALLELLSPSEFDRLYELMDNELLSMNDEDVCWYERTVWRYLPGLDERHAQITLWAIADGLQTGE